MPISFLPACLLSVLLLSSCSIPARPVPTTSAPASGIHLYLQPLPQEARRLTLTVSKILARTTDGTDRPLLDQPLELRGRELVGIQKQILAVALSPGHYQGLLVQVAAATLTTEDGDVNLLVPAEPLFVADAFQVENGRVLALFLSLRHERLISDGFRFNPGFSLQGAVSVLPVLKGLVSNPETGTVTVFNKKIPEVVALLSIGRNPKGVALDQRRLLAYLALAGDHAVAVIDLASDRVAGKIRLRLGDVPERLALSPDGQTLIVANTGSRSISIVDTSSLAERKRILLQAAPADVFFADSSDVAFVLVPSTNALSVVDVSRQQLRVSVNLDQAMERGLGGHDGRELYLLAHDVPNLLVLDTSRLAVLNRVFIGYGGTSLAQQQETGFVYVGRRSGGIDIVDPQLSLPIDSLQLDAGVAELALDREDHSLYALPVRGDRVVRLDLVSHRVLGSFEVGTGSFGITVVGGEQ